MIGSHAATCEGCGWEQPEGKRGGRIVTRVWWGGANPGERFLCIYCKDVFKRRPCDPLLWSQEFREKTLDSLHQMRFRSDSIKRAVTESAQ